jgi:hypothetical protein
MVVPPNPPLPPDQAHGKRQSRRKLIALLVLALVTALVVIGVYIGTQQEQAANPDNASVGDCMSKSGTDDVKVVPCGDAKAVYKMVGKVANKSQVDLSLSSADICKPFPAAKAAFWKGEAGKKGYILCLAPK